MEFSYPKGYKPKWNEADDMRRKSISDYYEKEALKKEQQEKMKNKFILVLIIAAIILFLSLKFTNII